MNRDLKKQGSGNYFIYIKALFMEIFVTALFILLFAVFMFFTGKGFDYSTVFATVSIAAGTLAAAFYAAKKIGSKGLLTGLVVGVATFLLITLISLIVDSGSLTANTLFHFIIIMLSALIGGVLGVNKGSNKKYI